MPVDPADTDRDLSRLRAAAATAGPELRGLLAHHVNNALTVVIAEMEFLAADATAAQLELITEALAAARHIAAVVRILRIEDVPSDLDPAARAGAERAP